MNNLNEVKRKLNLKRKGALAMAMLALLNLSGCSDVKNVQATTIEEQASNTKTFKPGEHTIAVSVLGNIYQGHFQAPIYPGYRCVGIGDRLHDSVICLYQNTEEVLCTTDIFNEDGTPIFSRVGTPIVKHETEEVVGDTRTFQAGEHTIAVPVLGNIYQEHFQAPTYPGYTCIGIGNRLHDSVICLYQNTEEVLCTTDNFKKDGTPIFSSIGTPTSKKLIK